MFVQFLSNCTQCNIPWSCYRQPHVHLLKIILILSPNFRTSIPGGHVPSRLLDLTTCQSRRWLLDSPTLLTCYYDNYINRKNYSRCSSFAFLTAYTPEHHLGILWRDRPDHTDQGAPQFAPRVSAFLLPVQLVWTRLSLLRWAVAQNSHAGLPGRHHSAPRNSGTSRANRTCKWGTICSLLRVPRKPIPRFVVHFPLCVTL
jgi:hypothetical protein